MTWMILALLLALAGTGGAVYLMMGSQKKKPIRVSYGSGPMGGDESISFPGEGFPGAGESPPQRTGKPRPSKKSAAAPARTRPQTAAGEAPRKKPVAKKRPAPQATGEPPKPKPKPRPSE